MCKVLRDLRMFTYWGIAMCALLSSGELVALPSQSSSDDEIDELLQMDISDLTVSVASKREERADEAPAVLNVVTAREIRESGARTLFEVLDRQPGIYGYFSLQSGENSVAIRGNNTNVGNNHTLILMNGRPVREGYSGGQDMNTLRAFPLRMIERLEIIRGPGSVLYGTNAFAGVVNIITKKATQAREGELVTSYGSFNSREAQATFGSAGQDYNLYAGIEMQKSDGWSSTMTDLTGQVKTDRWENQHMNMAMHGQYKGFALNASNSYLNEDHLGFPPLIPFNETWRRQRFIDLGYTHDISDAWQVSLNGSYNNSEHKYVNAALYDADEWLSELSFRGALAESTNIMLGGTWQVLEGRELRAFTQYSSDRYGLYAQLDHQLFDWLKLVGGLQLNKPDSVERDLSPRVAAIFDITDQWGAKLMYGEAFRSAYPAEQFINIPGLLVGDPTLLPEKVETVDAQLFYRYAGHYAALTWFHSRQLNTINATAAGFVNGAEIDSMGITLEGKSKINDQWNLDASVTWLQNEDQLTRMETYLSPNWLAKVGVTYKPFDGITVNAFENYVSGLNVSNAPTAPNRADGDYHLMTANIIVDLAEYSSQLPEGILFSAYGFNLLDQDVVSEYPDINAGPARSGRAFYGTLSMRF